MNPSTERPTTWVAPSRWTPARSSSVGERHALPHGVADQVAADLVGHALERDRHLDGVHGQQLVEVDRERLVDEAVDRPATRPAGSIRGIVRAVSIR